MNSHEYIPLNSWLSNADMLYLDGRLLWYQISGIGGGCVLLWLSLEQLMKTLVFQKRIQNDEFNSSDSENTFRQFHSWGIDIGHNLKDVSKELEKYYPNTLNIDETRTLEKIYEFFNRRYVVNTSSGISIALLHKVDSIYFKLRDLIDEDLPIAFIDEIALRNEEGRQHPLEGYRYAYLENKSFRKRSLFRV